MPRRDQLRLRLRLRLLPQHPSTNAHPHQRPLPRPCHWRLLAAAHHRRRSEDRPHLMHQVHGKGLPERLLHLRQQRQLWPHLLAQHHWVQ